MIKKAAIYCRISKEDSSGLEKESESITNQKKLLADYAYVNNWEIYKIYCDENYSGMDNARPEFLNLIKDAENRCFEIILCKTQSRFTRNMELVEKYINGLFTVWGVRFICIIDNIDTQKENNKKTRQINSLINEWYCEDLSDNIRAVFKTKMAKGEYLGSFPPYGYKKDGKNKLKIDGEAAETVKKIFDLYLSGASTSKIAGLLTQNGIKTPSMYKKSKGLNYKNPTIMHNVWSQNTIRLILTNPVYTGTLVQGKKTKESYKNKKTVYAPKEKWLISENNHSPIMETDVFNEVQQLIKHRKNGSGDYSNEYSLSGKVFCLDCGSTMQRGAYNKKKGFYYLKCGMAKKNKKCSPHSIRSDFIEDAVKEKALLHIENLLREEKFDFEELRFLNDNLAKESKNKDGEIKKEPAIINSMLFERYINYLVSKIEIGALNNKEQKIIIHWAF